MSSERWYHCTFTNQLTKKSKVFRDGLLRVKISAASQKIDLFDEANQNISIDGKLLIEAIDVKDGEQLLFDRHLIDVGEHFNQHESFNQPPRKPIQQSGYQSNPRNSFATLNRRVGGFVNDSHEQDDPNPSTSQPIRRPHGLPFKPPARTTTSKPLHPVTSQQLVLAARRNGKQSPSQSTNSPVGRPDPFRQEIDHSVNHTVAQSQNRPVPFAQASQTLVSRIDPFVRAKPSFSTSDPFMKPIYQTDNLSNNQPLDRQLSQSSSRTLSRSFTQSQFRPTVRSVMDLDMSIFDNDDYDTDHLTQPTSQTISRTNSTDQTIHRSQVPSINPFFDDLDTTPPTPTSASSSFRSAPPARLTVSQQHEQPGASALNQLSTDYQPHNSQQQPIDKQSSGVPSAKHSFDFVDDDDDEDGIPLFSIGTDHSAFVNRSLDPPVSQTSTRFPSSFASLRSQPLPHSNLPVDIPQIKRLERLPGDRFQPPRQTGAFSSLSKSAVEWKPGGDRSSNIALGGGLSQSSTEPSDNVPGSLLVTSNKALCPIRFISSIRQPKLSIPDRFSTLVAYQATFIAALTEQVNLMMEPTKKQFQDATAAWVERSKVANSRVEDGKAIEHFFRAKNVSFYHRDHLEINSARQQTQSSPFKRSKGKGKWSGRGKRGYDDYEADGDDAEAVPEKTDDDDVYWLSLSNQSSFEKTYHQHDLWIISNQPHFVSSAGQKSKGYSSPWVFFATSLFRGFSPQYQSMKVKALPVEGNHLPQLSKREKVYAIRSVELSNMLQMINVLRATSPTTLPLLPSLLHGDQVDAADLKTPLIDRNGSFHKIIQSLTIPDDLIDEAKDFVVNQFKLNVDQIAVVDHCVKWVKQARGPLSASDKLEPILLVHGCFGSGKSKLLVALVIMLCRIFDSVDSQKRIRIMLAALTNVAVDNLLQGLLDHGYNQFARVGSAKRIAEPILEYTAHCSAGSKSAEQHDQQAVKELQDKLSQAQRDGEGAQRVDMLRMAISHLKKEHGIKRRRCLMSQRVIGVTCAACSFEVLDGTNFPIILLDECSQLIEPASLVPLQRFGCERLIAVGDPKQLSPTLLEVEGEISGGFSSLSSCLSKALFERLAAAAVPMIALRHTYRMHPVLMALPNNQFYGSSLIDGITAADRPPLFAKHADGSPSVGLPPLLFINSSDGEEQRESAWGERTSGSMYNPAEIRHVTNLVAALIHKGLPASSIGVITLYRAQAWRLKKEIARVLQDQHNKSLHAAQQVNEKPNDLLIFDQQLNDIIDRKQTNPLKLAQSPPPTQSSELDHGIQVSTVDSFQGGEKDVIILSCVRTAVSDFLENERRVNVAMTRARHHFIVVGKQSVLRSSRIWQACIVQSMRTPGSFHNDSKLIVNTIMQYELNNEFLRRREHQSTSQSTNQSVDRDGKQSCIAPKRGVKRTLPKSRIIKQPSDDDTSISQSINQSINDHSIDYTSSDIDSSLSTVIDNHPIHQSINDQSISHSVNDQTEQPNQLFESSNDTTSIHELINGDNRPANVSHSARKSINQSINRSTNQSINQSINSPKRTVVDPNDDDDEGEYDPSLAPSYDQLMQEAHERQAQIDEEMRDEMECIVDEDEA